MSQLEVELALLPLDLARWDQAAPGDLFAVPVSTDVRPLRGAAGLLDWRLGGHLSDCLREERFRGERGVKLLIPTPTRRLPWRAVLAIGVGPSRTFDDTCFREALAAVVGTARGLGRAACRLALALPGRDVDLEPARAVGLLREALAAHAGEIAALTVVDAAPALKVMGELLGVPGTTRARSASSRRA